MQRVNQGHHSLKSTASGGPSLDTDDLAVDPTVVSFINRLLINPEFLHADVHNFKLSNRNCAKTKFMKLCAKLKQLTLVLRCLVVGLFRTTI